MKKPIEPGCMAIVINNHTSSNIGKIITVKKFIGNLDKLKLSRWPFNGDDYWEVDQEIIFTRKGTIERIISIPYVREQNLDRIDTDELPTEIKVSKSVTA